MKQSLSFLNVGFNSDHFFRKYCVLTYQLEKYDGTCKNYFRYLQKKENICCILKFAFIFLRRFTGGLWIVCNLIN